MSEAEQPLADPTADALYWRVDRRMTVLKVAGAGIFVLTALVFGQTPAQWLVGLAVAALLATFAVRDLIAPVRLAADAGGLTVVAGYAGRRRIPWAEVERVHVDKRSRLGRRLEFLEVDTGAELHLFNRAELSADPEDVAAALAHLRTGR